MDFTDFYQVLGVSKDADAAAIKAAYRKLARKLHPDLNPGDLKAESKFQDINNAYEVLKDQEERRKYDELYDYVKSGRRSPSQAEPGSTYGGYSQEDLDDLLSRENWFERIFGQRPGGGRATPRPGQDIRAEVEIEVEDAIKGSVRTVSLQREETCSTCAGNGHSQGVVCQHCRGLGRVLKSSSLEVKIPQGIADGSTIRLKGQGEAGLVGGPRGDLLLKVRIRSNETWEVDGANLKADFPISIFDAILGGQVDLVTPRGKLGIKIPPESQTGTVMRLSGLGLPRPGEQKAGDIYLRLLPQIPMNLSQAQKAKLLEIRDDLKVVDNRP